MPESVEKVKAIIEHILRNKISKKGLNGWDSKSIEEKWTTYNLETFNNKERKWYQTCVTSIMAITMCLRGAEQLQNEEKEWKEYGIKLRDVKWMWRGKEGKKFTSIKHAKNRHSLEAIELKLRNSKTKEIRKAMSRATVTGGIDIKIYELHFERHDVNSVNIMG